MVPYANIKVHIFTGKQVNIKYKTESPLAKEVNLVNAVIFFKDFS